MDLNNNIIIYAKQSGQQPVPVTARIKWLPDSSIKPLMYWTPDGSCFEVKFVHACTPIAFLKDRGAGLRFKVRAEVTETPDWDGEFLHTQHETYLYLADDRFCGKNFIDERYGHEAKEFIPVTLDIFPDGEYELISFCVQKANYIVVKTVAVEPHASFRAGGIGIRHKVEALRLEAEHIGDKQLSTEHIGDKQLNTELLSTGNAEVFTHKGTMRHIGALFFEVNKWFVVRLE